MIKITTLSLYCYFFKQSLILSGKILFILSRDEKVFLGHELGGKMLFTLF